jgi:hypothetical protein
MRRPEDDGVTIPNLTGRSLGLSRADIGASILKAGLGWIPFAGPTLTELITDLIPGQRTDRLVAFVKELDARLTEFSKDTFAAHARRPEGVDLMEDGLWMAARALTDERRKAIANLLVTTLTAEELKYAESKKLLQLLNELHDPEIIMLRYFYLLAQGDQRMDAFYDLHEAILQPGSDEVGQPEEELARSALYEARKATIKGLGLMAPRSDTHLSRLGFLLLQYIGLD